MKNKMQKRASAIRQLPNVLFYKNAIPSVPNGDLIENIHTTWKGNYRKLEMHHGFIQWLFPNTEDFGMNHRCHRLTTEEAEIISSDPECRARVLKSLDLMLDFYGMKIQKSSEDIRVVRNIDNPSWDSCYRNLETSPHNYLRITRILKSLGELGWPEYKRPIVEHVIEEMYPTLKNPESLERPRLQNCKRSLVDFWIPTLQKPDQKELLDKLKSVASAKKASVASTVSGKPKTGTVRKAPEPVLASNKKKKLTHDMKQLTIKDLVKQKRKELAEKKKQEQTQETIEVYTSNHHNNNDKC